MVPGKLKLAVLAITDRAHYFEQAHASMKEHLPEPDWFIKVDDTEHKLGFDGAVREGWRRIREETDAEYVFHAEDDFTYTEPPPLDRMVAVLERRPYLTQLSLLRQAVNEEERAAGGIIEAHPEQYEQIFDSGDVWVETRRFVFTTNPSIYPAAMCANPWPDAPESEGKFGARLAVDPKVRCGIWGALTDAPRVTHIGEHREGTGY